MINAHHLLLLQYQSVKGARQALFGYCKSMDKPHLFKQIDMFNGSSITQLLMHVANCYIHWLIMFDQETNIDHKRNEAVTSFEEIEEAYQYVDLVVEDFLATHKDHLELASAKRRPNLDLFLNVTPLELFTHVITHEFHHKGQVLAMSRLLGYIPIDTDVIRT